ncbi:tetratricopeptide repeat protein [Paracoccus sp. YLB-12]|uniref:Tetratricopeptide repeat protein n=1 Tax=Paracoccus maritimus TaxID=2933292 RepID=A0ABT2KB98_9RHOB|nr:tetratricopeptide repeat protein [Paracoccus sp. YLB-12]MCT4333651.1 tetratricopeptide repeat protein [Paracoccus sp. YLB-12]
MANQNDSFIDEVTEDLRRDRLFGLYRRYGWIALALILLLVIGVSWYEYDQARQRADAEAWGDAVLTAESSDDPAALLAVDADGSQGREALSALLAASGWVREGGNDAAAEALREVAGADAQDSVLHDLAELKLVMLNGSQMDPSERDAILTRLSRSGAPFELLALEQKAVALIEAGRTDDAITLIRQIQQKDGLSEALRRRLSEMMIALGVEPEPTDSMQAG